MHPRNPATGHRAGPAGHRRSRAALLALGVLVAAAVLGTVLEVVAPRLAAAQSEAATVRVGPAGDARYAPAEVAVVPGGTVTFVWKSNGHSVRHVPPEGEERLFDSNPACGPVLAVARCGREDDRYDVQLDEVGSYAFRCAVHEEMRGTIRVAEPAPPPPPPPEPSPEPEPPTESPSPRPSPPSGGGSADRPTGGGGTSPSSSGPPPGMGMSTPLDLPSETGSLDGPPAGIEGDATVERPQVDRPPPELEPFPPPPPLPDQAVALPDDGRRGSRTGPIAFAVVGVLGAGATVVRVILSATPQL